MSQFILDVNVIAKDLDPQDPTEAKARIELAKGSKVFMDAVVGRSNNPAESKLANQVWENLFKIAYPKE